MKIIGISGTNGSGKDSVAEILVAKHGFFFVGVTEILRKEARKRGLGTERLVLRTISAEWRRKYGLGVLMDKAVELYKQEGGDNKYKGLVIASLRNPGEVDEIHKLAGSIIWVDANPKIRYNRIYSRNRADDNKTFEQFIKEEQAEMHYSGDKATLSMQNVKNKADIILINEGSKLSDLEKTLREKVTSIL